MSDPIRSGEPPMLRSLLLRAYERLALNALASGDYPRAERMLRRMERQEGETRRVLHNLALARLGQGDAGGAVRLLDRLVDLYGEAPAVLRAPRRSRLLYTSPSPRDVAQFRMPSSD